jgi:hypothetical protein
MLDGIECRLMRMLPLIAVCLFMNAGFGHAQTKDDGSLRGLTQVDLLIENLDADSQACGITPQLLRDAFMFPASSTALKISETANATFYIQTATIHDNAGRCISSIRFELFEFQFLKPGFANLHRTTAVEFWHDYWMGFSGQNQHSKMIRDAVEVVAKKFLTKWNLDNKPQ